MLGTPDDGSGLADRLRALLAYRRVFGPAGQERVTAPVAAPRAAALVLPGPNDGKVTVASARLGGMADDAVVPTSHTRLASHPAAIAATLAFLERGRSPRDPAPSGPPR